MAWISATFRSAAVNMPVEVELLAAQPEECGEGWDGSYRVIILLHGLNGDRTEWLLKSRVSEMVQGLPVIVCMPSGKNSFFLNTANGYDYMDYVTKELPEWLGTLFPVSAKREDWLIAGESMGGYGALACGLSHPEQFGSIAALSAAVELTEVERWVPQLRMELLLGENWRGGIPAACDVFRQCHCVEPQLRPRLYLACGKQDELYEMNERFLREVEGEYDVTWRDGDGGHDFTYWNECLADIVRWFAGEVTL